MAFNPPAVEDTQAGDAVTTKWGLQVIESLLFLNGAVGGNLANDTFNGDFENDSDGDGVPDFWSKSDNHGTTYPGGTVAFETTSPLSGAQSMKFVHPGGAGNGGGLLESDYYECGYQNPFKLTWLHYATAAGMKNEVIVYWYDKDQVALGGTPSTTVYSSTNNPTSVQQLSAICNPPSGAKYYTIGLVGGFTDTDVAGTAYYDSVFTERTKLREYSVSASSSLPVLDLRDSRKLRITFINLTPTATTSILLTVSTDNGATFDTTSNYAGAIAHDVSGTNPALAFFQIVNVVANQPVTGSLEMFNLGQSTPKYTISDFLQQASATTFDFENRNGVIDISSNCNALRIYPSSGTMTGTIIVEELF